MAIIISKNGARATVVESSPLENEDQLQRFIFTNPESLPVADIKENAKLMVVGREFPTDSGPIDVLAIDADGDIYIVETKLYRNPDKRTVVAQVLDYGASLWATKDGSRFVSELDRQITEQQGKGLLASIAETYSLNEEDAAEVVENIKSKLQQGEIRFVVLMDHLHDQLKDLIKFLNQRSGFHVYAVEMEFYRHDGMEIAIPKLFGTESEKPHEASGGRRKLNAETFNTELSARVGEAVAAQTRDLIRQLQSKGLDAWGRANSISMRMRDPGGSDVSFTMAVFTVKGEFYLGWLDYIESKGGYSPGFAAKYLETVSKLAGVRADEEDVPVTRVLAHQPEFLAAVDELMSQLRQAASARSSK